MSIGRHRSRTANVDSSAKWNALEGKRAPEIIVACWDSRSQSISSRAPQTNLDGEEPARNPSGNLLVSTLDVTANVGDGATRWDTSLSTSRAGATSSRRAFKRERGHGFQ